MSELVITKEIDHIDYISIDEHHYLALETCTFSRISILTSTRIMYLLEQVDDKWQIKMLSYSLSPEGKELEAINTLLMSSR